MSCLYIVTNTTTGQQYVGQTMTSAEARWKVHVYRAQRGTSTCRALASAIVKCGLAAFTVEEISQPDGISQEGLDAAEQALIVRLGTVVPYGYNLQPGGHRRGRVHEVTRQRISETLRGRRRGPFSAAHRAALSAAKKGRKLGPYPPERGAAISAAKTGQKVPAISAALTGRKLSPSHLAAVREGQQRRRAHERAMKESV